MNHGRMGTRKPGQSVAGAMTEPNLSTLSLEYLERLYAEYVEHPTQVPPEWRRYFDELGAGNGQPTRVRLFPSIRPASIFHPPADGAAARALQDLQTANRQERVDQLIRDYRVRGHMIAQVDPLARPGPPPRAGTQVLRIHRSGSRSAFLDHRVHGADAADAARHLERCGTPTAARSACSSCTSTTWTCATGSRSGWRARENRLELTRDEQLRILTRLTDAVIFEEFIQKKYRRGQDASRWKAARA